MIKTDFMSLYEELSVLNEAKADVDSFINKFGEDTYELFKKSNQRLKNKGISTDLTYHVKHTDKKDLDAILLNLQNRAITKDDNLTELAGDYEYLGEDKGYKVYKINDVIASINFGAGTGWCISGRYGHYGEKNYTPTKETAKEHWDSYTSRGVQFYFFIGNKSKVALALYPKMRPLKRVIGNTFIDKTNCEIYNEQDKLDYSLFSSLPVDLINEHIIFEGIQAENGLYIKDNVLVKCDNSIKNVVIPDGTTKIAAEAFVGCKQLKTVLIPDSITSIGDDAFYYCSRIESLMVTTGNKKYHSANNCIIETETKKLIVGCKNSVIPTDGSVTSIGDRAFYNCSGLTSVTIGNSVTSIGSEAFYDCRKLTSVTIPNSMTSIGWAAFYNCRSLTSITIPGSVTSIGKWAFFGCSGLTSVAIGNGVTSIGDYAFSDCSVLTGVTIPDSVTSIGKWAFYNCSGLISVTIPSSVTSIGSSAFGECNGLAHVNYKGTEAQWNKIQIGDDNSCLTFAQRNYI